MLALLCVAALLRGSAADLESLRKAAQKLEGGKRPLNPQTQYLKDNAEKEGVTELPSGLQVSLGSQGHPYCLTDDLSLHAPC